MPTLVLNVTDKCDFHCYYCPEGGENLYNEFEENELIDVREIYDLMVSYTRAASQFVPKQKYVLRITGGEPLLNEETRKKVIIIPI